MNVAASRASTYVGGDGGAVNLQKHGSQVVLDRLLEGDFGVSQNHDIPRVATG
jgi:hypothetical protein